MSYPQFTANQGVAGHEAVRILFVDDEPLVQRGFARTVRRFGFVVDTVGSPLDAIERARRERYPIIVTDLRMPLLNGLALIEQLKPLQPGTSFVVLTGIPDLELAINQTIDSSIVSVVSKPWEDEELAAVLQRAADLYQQRSQSARPQDVSLDAAKLLLVEDDESDALLVQKFLEVAGIGVAVQVRRLDDALRALHESSYDAVLTDLALPDARGLDSVVRIRAAAPDAALVVFSGSGGEELALQALALGAQEFVAKNVLNAATLSGSLKYASERKRAERRLAHRAYFDALTGLANRATLKDRLRIAFQRAKRCRSSFAVLYVDLDGFRQINDRSGHAAGDALLEETARRLEGTVREYETVARIGGDEFAILIEETTDDGPAQVAERVLEELRRPYQIGGEDVLLTGSIGIAVFPETADNVDDLVRRADQAMQQAKDGGRNAFRLAGARHGGPTVSAGLTT